MSLLVQVFVPSQTKVEEPHKRKSDQPQTPNFFLEKCIDVHDAADLPLCLPPAAKADALLDLYTCLERDNNRAAARRFSESGLNICVVINLAECAGDVQAPRLD